jgi:hypothetical protein
MLLHIIVDRNCSCLTDAVVKFAVSGILYSFLFLILLHMVLVKTLNVHYYHASILLFRLSQWAFE